MLAKHGLVVWGDTAEEAYRRTIEVINQAVEFVNERTAGAPRFGGPTRRRACRRRAARALLRAVLPAVRGAVSSERSKVLVGRHLAARARVRLLARSAGELTDVGAPCPDHLVHTKRVPLWIPFDPATEDADALRARIASAPRASATTTAPTSRRHGDETTVPADPDARVVLIQHVGLVGDRARRRRRRRLSRDLYHRAIEVMAGAHALGGVHLADRGGELRGRVLAARALQALAGAAARRAAGQGRARHRAARAASAARSPRRWPRAGACVVAFDLDQEGAEDAVAALATRGWRSAAT